MELALVILVIVVALVFDYINGFHDAANSIATVVSTRVLSPGQAVVWAAFFNFVAAFVFGTAVAKTVGSGMVDINIVTTSVILAGLIGAIVWDLITWYYGLPTSSSHALIGGYAGAAVAKVGMVALIPSGWTKTLIFIVLAPMIGLDAGVHADGRRLCGSSATSRRRRSIATSASCSCCRPRRTASATAATTRRRRWASSPARLFAGGFLSEFTIPFWVVIAAHAAIALGTLAGGWRIIHTMGSKITRLQPVGGFAAETAGAISLFTATASRRAGQHDAHHHRRDHRRRIDAAAVGGAVGHCRSDRVGVDPDHSHVRGDRDGHLLHPALRGPALTIPAVAWEIVRIKRESKSMPTP